MFPRKSPVSLIWVGGLLLGCLLASAGMPGFGQTSRPGPAAPTGGAEPAGVAGVPLSPEAATEGAQPDGPAGPAPGGAAEGAEADLPGTQANPAAGSAAPAHGGWWNSIENTLHRYGLFQGVTASGQNSLTLQHNFLQGSQAAFTDQQWNTGDFYRQSSLEIAGPIWKDFGFQVDLSDSGWGQNYTQWVLGYVGHDTAMYYGDLNVDLPGNEFASFSQSVHGVQVDQILPGKGLMRAFYSQQTGYTHNETIAGNNTSGPYFLTYTPIIEGSLNVKVDETVLQLGTDYTVDYQSGELDFTPVGAPPRIIPSTSTISASYQSSGYNTNSGTLEGVRAEEPFQKGRGVIGFTALRQNSPGAGQGDTAAYQEDDYEGSGTTGPFDTNYRPILADGATATINGATQVIPHPLVVLVDGTQQVEGTDYLDYRQIGRIVFLRAVPPTSLVKIQYYYSLGATVGSPELTIMGLDLSYQINKSLALLTQYAHSSGGAAGTPGSALSNQLTFSNSTFNMMVNWQQMQPTFTYLDTSGFYTIESGLSTQMGWKPGKYLTMSGLYSDMMTNNGLSFGYSGYNGSTTYGISPTAAQGAAAQGVTAQQTTTTNLAEDVRSRQTSFGVQWAKPGAPSVSYNWDDMANSGGDQGDSSNVTNQIQVQDSFGKQLQVQAGWQRTSQSYGGSTTAGTTAAGSISTTGLFGFVYAPSAQLSLTANVNTNLSTGSSVTGTSSAPTTSSSTMLQLEAHWMPSSKLTVDLNRTGTVSNGAVTSGFYGNDTGGYYGGGGIAGGMSLSSAQRYFPGVALPFGVATMPGASWLTVSPQDATTPTPSTTSQDVSTTLGITYNPSEALSLGLNLGQHTYASQGTQGYLPDSTQDTGTVFATWKFASAWSVTASAEADSEVFTDPTQGPVTNRIYTGTLNYQPEKSQWGAALTLNEQSGSSPTYIDFGDRQPYLMVPTALTDVSTRVDYKLGGNSSAFGTVEVSSFDSGYSAFVKDAAQVGWQHDLSKTTQLQFSYQLVRNLAETPGSPIYVGTSLEGQSYMTNTFAVTLTTNFSGGVGGSTPGTAGVTAGAPGALSSSSLSTFGGYQMGLATGAPGGGSYAGMGVTPLSPGLGGSNGYSGLGNGYSGLGSGGLPTSLNSAGLTGFRNSSTMGSFSGGAGGFTQGLGQFQQKQATAPSALAAPTLGWGPTGSGQPGMPGGLGMPGTQQPAPPTEGAEPPGREGMALNPQAPTEGAEPEQPSPQPGRPGAQPEAETAGAAGGAEGEAWYGQEGLSRWDFTAPEDWWF